MSPWGFGGSEVMAFAAGTARGGAPALSVLRRRCRAGRRASSKVPRMGLHVTPLWPRRGEGSPSGDITLRGETVALSPEAQLPCSHRVWGLRVGPRGGWTPGWTGTRWAQ